MDRNDRAERAAAGIEQTAANSEWHGRLLARIERNTRVTALAVVVLAVVLLLDLIGRR